MMSNLDHSRSLASTDISFLERADDASRKEVDVTSILQQKDGGVEAWLTVAGSSLVYFGVFGVLNSFGFFQEIYKTTYLPWTPDSTIAFIGTIQITLMNLLAAPAGSLFDCYGLKHLYIFSGVGSSGALLALSFSQHSVLWQSFLIQGVLLGLAVAFGAQPAIVVIGQHFVRRRALTMGIVAAAGSVGGVCFPVILSQLAPRVGFAWSLRVVAMILVVCFAVALLISRAKTTAKRMGSFKELLDFKGFLDVRYSILTVGAFIAMLGQFVPYYYISSYSVAANPHSQAKDYLLPLMNSASFVGRILGGVVADETGPANVVFPMTILAGIQCLTMWLVTSNAEVLIAFVCMYGFCSGVFIAVLPVVIAEMSPEGKLGGRIGACYSVLSIGQLVGPPIGGALIKTDTANGYVGLITFAGLTLVVGGLLIFMSRMLHDRNIWIRF